MKYGKIRGIEKNICTQEQVAAYNLAFKFRDIIKKAYDRLPMGFQKNEVIMQAARKLSENVTKCDKDAVFCALVAGLENYINSDYAIIANYSEVGKMFPARYLD